MDLKEFNNVIEEYEKTVQEIQEKLSKNLKSIFKQMFDENQIINAFVWEQYTPYYNDGETCTFGVNEVTATNATGDDLNYIYYDEYDGDNEDVVVACSWYIDRKDEQFWVGKEKLKNFISNMNIENVKEFINMLQNDSMSDIMKMTFGDHVKIIATREGFNIIPYDHD